MRSPLIAIGLALCASTAQAQQARPNFLFILTDDVAQRHMPHARQTLSDLGEHGVTFERAYTDRPLCTPSRTTFFTGRYAASHGVRGQWDSNTSGWPGARRYLGQSYAVPLQAAGYATAFVGHFTVAWSRFENRATFRPPGWDRFIGSPGGPGTVYDNGQTRTYSGASTDAFVRFAKEAIVAAGSRPWAVQIGTHDAHDPYTPPPRYANALPSLTYPRDPAFNVPGIAYPPFIARQVAGTAAVRDTDTRFRGSTRELLVIDDAVAEMVSWLGQRGQLANTYFILSSDNGYHFRDHAIEPGKTLPIEVDTNVPLLIRGPGVRAGVRERRLATTADVAPTILAAAGIPIPVHMEGRSLLPLLRGQSTEWGNAVPYIRWANTSAGYGVRTERYTYFQTDTGAQKFLIDNQTDPFQLRNIVGSNLALAAQLERVARDLRACRGAACRTADRSG